MNPLKPLSVSLVITWRLQGITCTLFDKNGNAKNILQGISGCARPGR